jgi:phosphomannomutase
MEAGRIQKILQNLEICSLSEEEGEIGKKLVSIDSDLDLLEREIADKKAVTASLSDIFGILCTIIAEFPPYRFETAADPVTKKRFKQSLLDMYSKSRIRAVGILLKLFEQPMFSFLGGDLEAVNRIIKSNLEPRRYMPFRIIQIGKLADILFELSLHLDNADEAYLLRRMHACKYPRFGTSGWRARWKIDCNEFTAKCVAQAVCDFVKGNNVPGFAANSIPHASGRGDKTLLIGYDSRANARRIAEWVADVATQNDIKIIFTTRDTPTPALVYWATEVIGENGMAGIVNCTASHNPPEWQGIKFSPYNGVPAQTAITDFIASRAAQLKLKRTRFPKTPRGYSQKLAPDQLINPQESYCEWLLSSRRNGVPIDTSSIRKYYSDKHIIIDEMHGASRGYFRKVMTDLGVKYSVIHGEKSQKALEKLGYASPEWPYIAPLAQEVKKRKASLGVGLDTDGDRFGIISELGNYMPANRILPLLTNYLIGQGLSGKILRTVSSSRLIDRIAGNSAVVPEFKPSPQVVPAYINHAFYITLRGNNKIFKGLSAFLEPVGIKYVIEGMLIDSDYRVSYKPGFRNTMLLGGEESSGLTSKGHLPDKDGMWGNLLVMNMIATKQTPLEDLWKQLCSTYHVAFFERLDIDAADFAKERLVSYFFKNTALNEFAGLKVLFVGGMEYDMIEIQLYDEVSKIDVYLEIRASGTEPLNRIYVEAIGKPTSTEKEVTSLVRKVQKEVLDMLEEFSVDEIKMARTPRQLASILAVTSPDQKRVYKAVADRLSSKAMKDGTKKCLARLLDYVEVRNRLTVENWLSIFSKEKV